MVFSRLALEQPNVLVLDEPTNHLDLESIEALVAGLQNYEGTLILVSHDRWFVSQLATRVVEISLQGIRDYHGTYEEYVHACGDDHLDADTVVLRAKREERKARVADAQPNGKRNDRPQGGRGSAAAPDQAKLEALRDELTGKIESTELSLAEIDGIFAGPGYFESTSPDKIKELQNRRADLQEALDRLMAEWERVEGEIERGRTMAVR
jgi:energy-coupling factor transporter ATP-binding protein EcfA2